MIIREEDGRYVLTPQHEHALASGEFARHWNAKLYPSESVLYAVSHHDIGWRELDAEALREGWESRPHNFTEHPIGPRLRAYRRGIDRVEEESPYAACLCSMHYSALVRRDEDAAGFLEEEDKRRAGIQAGLSGGEIENLDYNFRLLQLCDDLSLFVCLNGPGRNDHPFYRDGFRFMGERLEPVWEDPYSLRIKPNPFSEPFELAISCLVLEKDGTFGEDGKTELRVAC